MPRAWSFVSAPAAVAARARGPQVRQRVVATGADSTAFAFNGNDNTAIVDGNTSDASASIGGDGNDNTATVIGDGSVAGASFGCTAEAIGGGVTDTCP